MFIDYLVLTASHVSLQVFFVNSAFTCVECPIAFRHRGQDSIATAPRALVCEALHVWLQLCSPYALSFPSHISSWLQAQTAQQATCLHGCLGPHALVSHYTLLLDLEWQYIPSHLVVHVFLSDLDTGV